MTKEEILKKIEKIDNEINSLVESAFWSPEYLDEALKNMHDDRRSLFEKLAYLNKASEETEDDLPF